MVRRGFATAVACAVPVLLTLVLNGCDTTQISEAGAIETTEPSAIETTEPSAFETTESSAFETTGPNAIETTESSSAIETTEPGVSPSGTTTRASGFLSTTQPSTSAAGASTSASPSTSAGPSTTPNTVWPRSDALDAQFLIQATFGPTHSSLAELKGKDSYEAWILEQMELDASLLRSYYRSRVNPSAWQKDSVARSPIPRSPCEVGSRWSNVAFDLRDVGLQVVATGNEIFVDGQLRSKLDPQLLKNGLPAPTSCTNEKRSWWTTQECATEIRHWTCGASTSWSQDLTCQQSCWDGGYPYPGDDCSVGWRNFVFTGYICSVPEAAEVGDMMTMSTSSDCSSFVVMRIPAMWMDSMTDTDSALFAMVRPNIIILTSSPASCAFGEWLQVNGSAYRHDLRYKLLDTSSADQELCVAVPSTIFNLEQCKVLAGRVCDVAQASSASLNLTAETSEQLSSSGRYIYEISGLRTTATPCSTLSRWKLCTGCTASTLDSGDRTLIVNALESKEGDLRDIFVNCNSVSANAVVSLSDNKLFQHVHLQEGNLYDFTTWVTEHPGGQDAITKWTSSGYKLQYPSNHPMDRFETHLSRLQYIAKSGETIRYGSLPSTVKSDTLALQLSNISSSQTFTLGCPSPGETANAPLEGNNAHFFTRAEQGNADSVQEADVEFDFPSREREARDLSRGKINMWMGQVMSASDQLRQRMAWALSQILVVGTGGFGHTRQTELWLNYYDILVRKAFGNYLDLLKEVTFSPLMGEYLSFLRNSAFDHDQNYPDENYAREVMQLFTIGTVQLTPEGSIKLDSEGSPIPNYNNEDIMTFARVFTGLDRQVPRRNLEEVLSSNGNGRNIIDPMQMVAKWHDNYPKQDLDKNYLGDGLPPCADLPKGSFLMKGARYEFASSYTGSGVLQLQADSPLYQALCGSSGVCSFQPTVILQQDLTCSGNECHAVRPSVVELSGQGVFFEYVLPRCMHFYFFEGRIVTGGGERRFWDSKRVCSNPETPQGGSYCCTGCSNISPQWMLDADSTCETRSQGTFEREDTCAGNSYWTQVRLCEKRCFEADNGYGNNCSVEGSYREDHVCGFDEELVSFAAAEKNCNDIGMKVCDRKTASSKCNYNSDTAQVWTLETCSVNISIDSEGKVASYQTDKTKMNKVSVNWNDGALDVKSCPSTCTTLTESCLCPMRVETQAVFNRVPDASELSQLKVGAFKPNTECNSCGEVKAYFSGSIDANTVFEYEGKYFRNMRSVVFVGGKSFRNPPVIGDDVEHTAASATQEIEALLEHLVYHPNTAPFLSFRLIQRFGTSSPSITYVRDVATAFRTGRYGRTYSGQYGDLAATVAAILLHPEARDASAASSTNIGALREPLVKLVHFLRAMEFQDTKERDLLFQAMQDRIGQEPFASPTVFNFYMPDYELPSGQIAPEFQIFESASLVNFLNGMFSLIDHQGITDCNFGFGVRTDSCDYSSGSLKLKLSTTNSTDALNDLDLLLTGSRLSTHEREAVMTYTQQKGDVKAIQEAVVLTPAFQTVGAPKPVGPRAAETQTATKAAPRSYKAVVNLYLGGGADTFNLVVPINCALHDEYVAVRGEAALGNTKLLEISSSQACQSFGLHYKLPKLRELYQAGEAAFVSNIGALVQPLTKHEYRSGSKPTCVGLFSHSDQTSAAQTLKCQVAGASPKGVGGRMADVLAAGSQKFSTSSFSLKGKKTWSEGFTVVQQAVDGSGDVRTLEKYAERRPLIANLTKEELANIYSEEYSKNLGKMIDNAEVLAGQLANVTLSTTWPVPQSWSDGVLLKQFQAVSKLIASSEARKVEREFFYVELGGFDTHNDFDVIDDLFAKIDESLDLFVKELKAQGVFDSVVLVTTSDFGRTLTSNGKGTDHGWAGNHFVLGGKVKGGEIYNQFPSSLLEGNLYDVGRGRLIPKYPWESVMLPIAEWMGVDTQDRNTVFPNLQNFNSSMLLSTSALFST